MRELLYGRNAIYEVLRAGRRRAYRLVLAEGLHYNETVEQVVSLAEAQRVPIDRVDRRELDRIGSANHQGVALEASEYPYVDLTDILAHAAASGERPLILLLDLLQDPQNLGALFRTAEVAGVHGAVIQERRAAGVTPAVVNVSSGAVEHLRVAQVTNLADTIASLKARDVWVAGLEAQRGSQPYASYDMTVPLALVVGSEGEGLRRLVRERCDVLLEVPVRGHVNSLNAAVAGAVVIYEAVRQRQAAKS